MGAWGTGLYENDDACDVRDYYQHLLVNNWDHEDALLQIIKKFRLYAADEGNAACWFALADCAWHYGTLDKALKEHALILAQANLEKDSWVSPALNRKRIKCLTAFAKKISKPCKRVRNPETYLPGERSDQENF